MGHALRFGDSRFGRAVIAFVSAALLATAPSGRTRSPVSQERVPLEQVAGAAAHQHHPAAPQHLALQQVLAAAGQEIALAATQQAGGQMGGLRPPGGLPLTRLQNLVFQKALHGIRVVKVYEGRNASSTMSVKLREEIYVLPATGSAPVRYRLKLVGVDGLDLDAPQLEERRRRYGAHMSFLLNHRDFNVRDWQLASLHYDVEVRPVVERGRNRDVYTITPRQPGRSSFEVRVDPVLEVIVGQREFDSSRNLVFEWEYETLVVGPSVKFPQEPDWYWTPIRPMEVHPDVEAATKAVASQFQPRIPDANQVPAGFRLMEVRTTFEPMLRKLFLILDYSDGISSMFLVQSAAPGGRAPVPALPGLDSSDPHGDPRIFRHVAGGHSQCWTARGGLHLLVVSRVTDGQIPDFLVALLK